MMSLFTLAGNICQKMKCDFYSECHLSHDEKPRCVCLESCEKLIRPLCASDGRSYDNMCEMKRRSCVLKKWITFSKAGLCGDYDDDFYTFHVSIHLVDY